MGGKAETALGKMQRWGNVLDGESNLKKAILKGHAHAAFSA